MYTRNREDRKMIRMEWIENVMANPDRVEIQKDGRIRKWGWIEHEMKYLRVILLEDNETVHNAFFDRNFKENI